MNNCNKDFAAIHELILYYYVCFIGYHGNILMNFFFNFCFSRGKPHLPTDCLCLDWWWSQSNDSLSSFYFCKYVLLYENLNFYNYSFMLWLVFRYVFPFFHFVCINFHLYECHLIFRVPWWRISKLIREGPCKKPKIGVFIFFKSARLAVFCFFRSPREWMNFFPPISK